MLEIIILIITMFAVGFVWGRGWSEDKDKLIMQSLKAVTNELEDIVEAFNATGDLGDYKESRDIIDRALELIKQDKTDSIRKSEKSLRSATIGQG